MTDQSEEKLGGERAPDAPRSGLGRSAARGVLIMSGGQVLRVLVQITSVVLLARFLAPADFGVLAMVTALIGVGAVLRDFGLGQAAIQAPKVTQGQKSNLFWINLVLGMLVAAFVYLAAPLVAAVYDQPHLAPVVQLLSGVFVLGGVSIQFRAELNRSLQFRHVVVSELIAQTVGVAVAVLLAFQGFGYWSLVAQQIADALILCVLSAILSGWRPGLPRREPMSDFFRFGWGLFGTQMVIYASQNIDSLLIGRRFGAEALGQYNRAFQLLMLPINQISAPATKVALPVLSRLQDDRHRFDMYVVRANLIVGSAVIGFLGFSASQSEALVQIVLGSQWAEAASLFRYLAIAGMFQVLSYSTFWIFLAQGRTRSNLRFTIVTRAVLTLLLIAASFHGVAAVALAYSIGLAISWPVGLFWVRRWGPSRTLALQGLRLLLYGSWIACSSWLTSLLLDATDPLLRLMTGGLGSVVALCLLFALLRVARRDFMNIVDTVRLFRRGSRKGMRDVR